MALWDVADALTRAKTLLNRPTTDNALSDTIWYQFFTEGQSYWAREFASYFPQANRTIATMTTSDGGYTYSVASEPLTMMVKKSRTSKYVMIPGEEWDQAADYVQEGKTIRRPNNGVFSEAPVAYYVPAPGVVDGTTGVFTLKPDFARILIVKYACVQAAKRLKLDWGPYEDDTMREWFGDPRLGSLGILGQMRKRYPDEGIPTPGARPYWMPNG